MLVTSANKTIVAAEFYGAACLGTLSRASLTPLMRGTAGRSRRSRGIRRGNIALYVQPLHPPLTRKHLHWRTRACTLPRTHVAPLQSFAFGEVSVSSSSHKGRTHPVPAQMWKGRAQSRCRCGRVRSRYGCGIGLQRHSPAPVRAVIGNDRLRRMTATRTTVVLPTQGSIVRWVGRPRQLGPHGR